MQVWQWALGFGLAFIVGVLIPTIALLFKLGGIVAVNQKSDERLGKLEGTVTEQGKVLAGLKSAFDTFISMQSHGGGKGGEG